MVGHSVRFRELARGKIGTNKFLVASERSDGQFSIAQQVEAQTDDRPIRMYLKNALLVDLDGLKAMRDMLNEAVESFEKK